VLLILPYLLLLFTYKNNNYLSQSSFFYYSLLFVFFFLLQSTVTCSSITNTVQCSDENTLSHSCSIYEGKCKRLCGLLSEEECDDSGREEDCLWVEESDDGTILGKCIDRVCCIYISR
jgi:hypothetical protein